jgi:hypothetical protein
MRLAWSTGMVPHSTPRTRSPSECFRSTEKRRTWQKKGAITDEWLGRSRGGITSRIHLCVDGHGLSLSVLVTAGQCSSAAQIGPELDVLSVPRSGRGLPRKRPTCLRVDRAYGALH